MRRYVGWKRLPRDARISRRRTLPGSASSITHPPRSAHAPREPAGSCGSRWADAGLPTHGSVASASLLPRFAGPSTAALADTRSADRHHPVHESVAAPGVHAQQLRLRTRRARPILRANRRNAARAMRMQPDPVYRPVGQCTLVLSCGCDSRVRRARHQIEGTSPDRRYHTTHEPVAPHADPGTERPLRMISPHRPGSYAAMQPKSARSRALWPIPRQVSNRLGFAFRFVAAKPTVSSRAAPAGTSSHSRHDTTHESVDAVHDHASHRWPRARRAQLLIRPSRRELAHECGREPGCRHTADASGRRRTGKSSGIERHIVC